MNQFIDFDEKLYAGLRQGDEAAFTVVFERYNRLLYALAFMKVWGQRDSFDFRSGIRSLLFTILKNYILNELRHRQIVFEKHYEIAQQGEEVDEGFLKEFESKELKEHLWSAISELPPQKRKICQLKIGKGLSNQEIADMMQITVPTVKSHYTQAIKLLRSAIEPLIMLLHAVWLYFFY